MTYGDHLEFLEREIEQLGRAPFDLAFQSFLEEMGRDHSQEVEAAVRVYASTLHWPPLSERVRFAVCLRLSCAKWWCEDLRDVEVEGTGSELIESLLIDYWRDVGRADWIYETFVQDPDTL